MQEIIINIKTTQIIEQHLISLWPFYLSINKAPNRHRESKSTIKFPPHQQVNYDTGLPAVL